MAAAIEAPLALLQKPVKIILFDALSLERAKTEHAFFLLKIGFSIIRRSAKEMATKK